MADYSPNVWSTGDLITAALLNHGEGQYAAAKSEFQSGAWLGSALTPPANGTVDIGLTGTRFKDIYAAGSITGPYAWYANPSYFHRLFIEGGSAGSLYAKCIKLGSTYSGMPTTDGTLQCIQMTAGATPLEVITSARVLQNVTADAGILTGTIAAARLPTKTVSLFMHAGGIKPRTSNGCASLAWTELSTNKVMVPTLDFDGTNNEYAQGMVAFPDGWNGGTITFRVHWTFAAGSGNVIWGLQARSFGDGEALDQAFGTAVEVTDTALSANQEHISPTSGNVTPAGTPAGGELLIFQIYRNAASASDTMSSNDARLLGVTVEFTAAYTD